MPIDLSLSGQLGYAALDELRTVLLAAQKTAAKAGQMANESLALSKMSGTLIGDLAKLQPSAAGDKVLRWLEANTPKNFDLVKDPTKAFAEFRQSGIELQDFGAGGVNVVEMHAPIQSSMSNLSVTSAALHHHLRHQQIQDFL
jgi:hypothetical protein